MRNDPELRLLAKNLHDATCTRPPCGPQLENAVSSMSGNRLHWQPCEFRYPSVHSTGHEEEWDAIWEKPANAVYYDTVESMCHVCQAAPTDKEVVLVLLNELQLAKGGLRKQEPLKQEPLTP